MGMFTPSGYAVAAEPFDIENMTFEECTYENPFEAASYLVAESENNYNSIIKAMAMDELYVYESTGVEMVYEAGKFASFFAKVKEFFKKLWEKIKGIFQRFFAQINSVILKDKEFVKKYKNALSKVRTKDFEYKGFKFDKLDAALPSEGEVTGGGLKKLGEISGEDKSETLKTYSNGITDEKFDDMMDVFRGKTMGKGKIDSDDFSTELFEFFRSGESTKDTIENIDPMKCLREIEGAADMKKKAEKDLKDLKKTIDDIIKELEKAEKEQTKKIPGAGTDTEGSDLASAKINALSDTVKVLKGRMDIVTLFSAAKLKAMKDNNAQNKAICVKLLTYKPKTESAGFVHTEGGSYLDSVVFR